MTVRPSSHFPRESALDKRAAASWPSPPPAVSQHQTSIPPFRCLLQKKKRSCAKMARLNTHHSATPLQTRSSTVDSLYRDPSVAPRNASSARGTTYSVMSPSQSSDKENVDSESRERTPQPAKRKGLGSASGRIPTPDTGSTTGSGSNKRSRTDDYDLNGASGLYEDEDEEEDQEEEPEQPQRRRTATTQPEEDEEDSQSKLYDPNQDPIKRRDVRYRLRENNRQLEGQYSSCSCAGVTANRAQITATNSLNRATQAYTSCF
jgi:hypothetical protein